VLDGLVFRTNSERAERQLDLDIRVIVGNPPFPRKWSCCGVVCGHVEPDPSDVEAGPFAA